MNSKLTWQLLPFNELSTSQLYDILHLRNKVFAVEQDDVYLDIDYQDQQALHLMACVNQKLVAYCRIFPPTDLEAYAKIGRVVIDTDYRKHRLGYILMHEAFEVTDDQLNAPYTYISAQVYLQRFYEKLGFATHGEPYMDGTIEHIDMIRQQYNLAYLSCSLAND